MRARQAAVRDQMRLRLASPDIDQEELRAISDVLASGVLTNGPRTRMFEEQFAARHQVAHAVAVANGTIALAGIYMALKLGSGDEVIVPSMTFVSTATSVLHVGATPVFADVEPDTFGLDPADVARKITTRTRAIVAVHYGGQAGELDSLRELAQNAGLVLLEDAAEAHGATYRRRPVGGWGRAAMFSFTPTKNITTGEGGMVTTDDALLADHLRLLRNHGQTAPYVHHLVGFNWRMTEIQAAMGLVQIRKLDAILARKRRNANWMQARLGGVPGLRLPVVGPDRDHTYMLYTILVESDRDRVLRRLHDARIEARLYFPPVHLQPIFADSRTPLPVTEDLAAHMISLPFHSLLAAEDLEYLADSLVAALRPPH